MQESDPPADAAPGDITVTALASAYLIGRVLAVKGPVPWWEYLASIKDMALAVRFARELAQTAGTKAWLHNGSAYTLIRSDPPT